MSADAVGCLEHPRLHHWRAQWVDESDGLYAQGRNRKWAWEEAPSPREDSGQHAWSSGRWS